MWIIAVSAAAGGVEKRRKTRGEKRLEAELRTGNDSLGSAEREAVTAKSRMDGWRRDRRRLENQPMSCVPRGVWWVELIRVRVSEKVCGAPEQMKLVTVANRVEVVGSVEESSSERVEGVTRET